MRFERCLSKDSALALAVETQSQTAFFRKGANLGFSVAIIYWPEPSIVAS
jgi:hypothetical protein